MFDKQGKFESFIWFLVRHKRMTLLFILLITGVFASGIPKINSQVILQHMFPHDHPYLRLMARFSQVFGLSLIHI